MLSRCFLLPGLRLSRRCSSAHRSRSSSSSQSARCLATSAAAPRHGGSSDSWSFEHPSSDCECSSLPRRHALPALRDRGNHAQVTGDVEQGVSWKRACPLSEIGRQVRGSPTRRSGAACRLLASGLGVQTRGRTTGRPRKEQNTPAPATITASCSKPTHARRRTTDHDNGVAPISA